MNYLTLICDYDKLAQQKSTVHSNRGYINIYFIKIDWPKKG